MKREIESEPKSMSSVQRGDFIDNILKPGSLSENNRVMFFFLYSLPAFENSSSKVYLIIY